MPRTLFQPLSGSELTSHFPVLTCYKEARHRALWETDPPGLRVVHPSIAFIAYEWEPLSAGSREASLNALRTPLPLSLQKASVVLCWWFCCALHFLDLWFLKEEAMERKNCNSTQRGLDKLLLSCCFPCCLPCWLPSLVYKQLAAIWVPTSLNGWNGILFYTETLFIKC